ncbi:MAG: U32 family peptidase [Bacilli bacterium]|nr:U32 family peptidase [Bacilli bacterium]
MNRVELLAPAGNMDKLKVALLYGADAVYIGGKNYSLRANATNFKLSEIKEAVKYAHKLKKKVYVAVNIVFHNDDYKELLTYLKSLELVGVDAIISSDPSVIDLVKNNKINLDIHLSTQMSSANYEAVRFWKGEGVKRIVLARECSRDDIKTIIDKTGVEVECFLHGAMCSAYSGRCVLSNYFTNRDANRGGCAQICRWVFDLNDGYDNINNKTKFTMCTKDLSMISCLADMIEIGIKSLKVEGRMRSNYYIATVISTYREAIDHYYNGDLSEELIEYYSKILNRVANRESTEQFFNKKSSVDDQYFVGREEASNQDFLGIVMDYDKKTKMVTLTQRNYFKPGDEVEIFGPSIKAFSFKIPDIYNDKGEKIEVANHPEEIIKFKLDKEVYRNDIMRVKVI